MTIDGNTLLRTAFRQTAIEFLRLYEATKENASFQPVDEDAYLAWSRIARDIFTHSDLELIDMRSTDWLFSSSRALAARQTGDAA